MGPVWGLLVCGYGLTERGRPSRPVSGLAGANVANGGPLITVWTRGIYNKKPIKNTIKNGMQGESAMVLSDARKHGNLP